MDKKNLMPNQASPINRMTTGQLPPELAELAEETLCSHDEAITPSGSCFSNISCAAGGVFGFGIGGFNDAKFCAGLCSYEGDDTE
ncbi:DUF5837 family cyanobactin class RiPP [Leptothoe sp. ISB3NOV94-8A]|uniref:Microcyclamide/patellamide family RiPP n=1 Tax=Adonisia turfae CCMR0081 TaxID=2292702 RepID=A0A6M0RIH0_9CYAN|nr:DUF5837 family cyanobactin class RiPP [Adonisia turfae]NEZ56017.1 microcyclamide/patellamide family RiPP [Adonisia turfae CCMR0081]